MTTAGPNDLVVRVRLDTTQAKAEWKKQEDSARQLGAAGGLGIGKMAMGAAAGVFGAILAPTLMQAGQTALHPLHNMMRASFFGKPLARARAGQEAEAEAMRETADMFGPIGDRASRTQILTLFDALNALKQREAMGRTTAEDVISEHIRDRDLQVITNAIVNGFGQIADHFTSIVTGGGRPGIK